MSGGWTVVLDVGKSLSKATLWDEMGTLRARRSRPNPRVEADGHWVLDVQGIEQWLKSVLGHFALRGPIDAIVPVAHGAGAALIRNDRLQCLPLDYEWSGVAQDRKIYDEGREPFALTGSPALPAGLNLGIQLHWLELRKTANFKACTILPWAQYWAWVLCGTCASEVSSLGCHTDLWHPFTGSPSSMSLARGWAERLAPLRRAHEVLGTVKREWIEHCGLAPHTQVFCGLHDSNAALLGSRAHPEIDKGGATLSTGTWFVAMRSPGSAPSLLTLPEGRDCLVNVDVAGLPVPSARFMGGREIELLTSAVPEPSGAPAQIEAAVQAIERGAMILPGVVPGVGPYPHAKSDATHSGDPVVAQVYAALVADVSLDLIGGCKTLIIEGRFARAPVFTRALASLRPETLVWVSHEEDGVTQGALALLKRGAAVKPLRAVDALDVDIGAYREAWRNSSAQAERAA